MRTDQALKKTRRFHGVLSVLAVLTLLPPLVATPAEAKPFKEVTVICADGDSINKELARRDTELLINIVGICTEDVVVRRDRVTLRGADPALDGIRAATVDDPYGAALFIRGGRIINVENLQLTGAKHAGLLVEDVRRNVVLRNLRIESNREVGLLASNSLVVGFGLSINNNGLAGVGLSENAYLRCEDCIVEDNPSASAGFGVLASAGAFLTFTRGSIAAQFPLSMRFNSVGDVQGAEITGLVALDASGSARIRARGTTIDGSIRADQDSQLDLRNCRQAFNPAPGGNVVTGASQMSVSAGTQLIGETVFDEFSTGLFSGAAALESLACSGGADAICEAGVTMTSSSCGSCP